MTNSHQAAVDTYTKSLVDKLLKQVRNADPSDIDKWFRDNRKQILALIEKGHLGTANFASVYLRSHARANGAHVYVYKQPFNEHQTWSAIEKTGPAVFKKYIRTGADTTTAQAAMLRTLKGSIYRMVFNGGRNTIQRTIDRNDSIVKYRRVSLGSPCAYCAMLISRGAVYKHESSNFQAHDHDKCLSEPVYDRNEPERPEVKKYRAIYDEVTQEYTGVGKLNAFRRALEN